MIEEITPESIYAEIRLLQEDDGYEGVFLIVEGVTDFILFSQFFNKSKTTIRSIIGKANVLKLIDLANKNNNKNCLAIVDADFWLIDNIKPQYENIFITDTHDIETMIFKTPSLEKIFFEYFPSHKIQDIVNNIDEIRKNLLLVSSNIGLLRWINYKHKFNICFYADKENNIPFKWETVINIKKFKVDFEGLLQLITGGNYQLIIKLRPFIRKYNQEPYNLYELCNGHDVLYITFLFLNCHGRKKDTCDLSINVLEKMLRTSYETKYFQQTDLYRCISSWQSKIGIEILNV